MANRVNHIVIDTLEVKLEILIRGNGVKNTSTRFKVIVTFPELF